MCAEETTLPVLEGLDQGGHVDLSRAEQSHPGWWGQQWSLGRCGETSGTWQYAGHSGSGRGTGKREGPLEH